MYWVLGDMDELALKNPVSLSAGTGKLFREGKWMVSTSFIGSTRIIEDYDPPMSLSIGLGHFISTQTSLSGTFSFGLTESSSDFSAGFGCSIKI